MLKNPVQLLLGKFYSNEKNENLQDFYLDIWNLTGISPQNQKNSVDMTAILSTHSAKLTIKRPTCAGNEVDRFQGTHGDKMVGHVALVQSDDSDTFAVRA